MNNDHSYTGPFADPSLHERSTAALRAAVDAAPEIVAKIAEEAPAPVVPNSGATRSTFYDNLKGLPPFFTNRRNRAKTRAKIDKTRRNQRAIRQIKNAFKRGVPGVHDIRIDVSDRDTYASCKPIFRGVKKWVREQDREARLNALMDDQRCREHIMKEAFRAADGQDDLLLFERLCANAHADYHRLAPVTPYVTVAERARLKAEAEEMEREMDANRATGGTNP